MTRRGKFKTHALDSVMLDGTAKGATAAGTTDGIRVLIYDRDRDILLATGTDVPADTTSGYAKGCVFIDRDVAAGTTGFYENVGTSSSCNFDQIWSGSTVSLEDLDAGITPSHVVKYAGEVTWTGSGATLASTVTGVLATDIVVASFHTLGTEGTILQGAYASAADTITYTLDAANTSNDAVISYQVLRAAV